MPQPNERDLERTQRQLGAWLAERVDADEIQIEGPKGPSETGFSSDTLMFDLNTQRGGATRREQLVARLQPVGSRAS